MKGPATPRGCDEHRKNQKKSIGANRPTDLRPADKTTILCLTIAALSAALLSSGAVGTAWLPAWAGAAITFAALLGVLSVFWRAGALRMRFLLLFVAALAAAALYGWLSALRG